ncbi:MAG: hypothetical protein MJ168_03605 [Clostridia bacterium]|nr:hypothetical protein [Clostridia bacterium]
MTTAFAIRTILEIAAVLLVTLGILHEDKFIIFEENVARIVRKKIRAYKRRKAIERRRAQGNHLRVVHDRRAVPAKRSSVA